MPRSLAGALAVAVVALALLSRPGALAQEPPPRLPPEVRFARDCEQIERELRGEAQALGARCGLTLEVKVDWRSLPSRDLLDRYSMSGFCAPPLTALRELCDEAGQAIQRKLRRFVCRYGGQSGGRALRLRGGTLEWAWDAAAQHNGDFARQALRRSF